MRRRSESRTFCSANPPYIWRSKPALVALHRRYDCGTLCSCCTHRTFDSIRKWPRFHILCSPCTTNVFFESCSTRHKIFLRNVKNKSRVYVLMSFEQWRQSGHARWLSTDTFVQLSNSLRGTELALYAIASGRSDRSLLAVVCVARTDCTADDNWHIPCEPHQDEKCGSTFIKSLEFLPWAF